MLNKSLSEDLCSLLEGRNRVVLAMDIYLLNDNIELIEFKICNINVSKNYCYDEFDVCLNDAYFGAHSRISLIDPELPNFFQRLQFNGVKIALNTGYERNFQKKIINHFNMNEYIDDFISSGDVRMGRPYPYMIHRIMERNHITSVKQVAKVGDTRNDVLEGKNAGCGITIAVQTGAGTTKDFLEADLIVDKITSIDMVVDDGFFL